MLVKSGSISQISPTDQLRATQVKQLKKSFMYLSYSFWTVPYEIWKDLHSDKRIFFILVQKYQWRQEEFLMPVIQSEYFSIDLDVCPVNKSQQFKNLCLQEKRWTKIQLIFLRSRDRAQLVFKNVWYTVLFGLNPPPIDFFGS